MTPIERALRLGGILTRIGIPILVLCAGVISERVDVVLAGGFVLVTSALFELRDESTDRERQVPVTGGMITFPPGMSQEQQDRIVAAYETSRTNREPA